MFSREKSANTHSPVKVTGRPHQGFPLPLTTIAAGWRPWDKGRGGQTKRTAQGLSDPWHLKPCVVQGAEVSALHRQPRWELWCGTELQWLSGKERRESAEEEQQLESCTPPRCELQITGTLAHPSRYQASSHTVTPWSSQEGGQQVWAQCGIYIEGSEECHVEVSWTRFSYPVWEWES